MNPARQKATIFCTACEGWGTSPIFTLNKCLKCNGAGVTVLKGGVEYSLRIPGYVDGIGSENVKTRKISMFFISAISLFVLLTIIVIFIK